VLVRAVESISGIDAMRAARLSWWTRRRTRSRRPAAEALETEGRRLESVPDIRLASGPGLVAAAFGIDRSMTGLDLTDPGSPLRLESRPADMLRSRIVASPRLGIDYAGAPWVEQPWRFSVAGHPSVSGPGGRGRAR
jgi:3-methyladenine DNA glycosylase Mpg